MSEKIIHILATCLLVLAHTNLGVQAGDKAKCLIETWGGQLDSTHYQASTNSEATDGETYQVNQFYNGIGKISGVSSARINGNRCVVTFKDAYGATRCTLPSGDYPYKEFMRNGCGNDVVTQYTVSISKETTVAPTTPTTTSPTTPTTPTTPPPTTEPSNTSPQANSCTDTAAWSDGWGGTCEYYRTSGACKKGEVNDVYLRNYTDMFNSPEKNCCVCGKYWFPRDNNRYTLQLYKNCTELAELGYCGVGYFGIDVVKQCPVTCRGESCHSIENGATDMAGRGCKDYDIATWRCGYYDDQDFVSRTMCCACGGGMQKDSGCSHCFDTSTDVGCMQAIGEPTKCSNLAGTHYCSNLKGSYQGPCAYRACPIGWFTCDNGKCITESYKCDRNNDCGDHSDERNCPDCVCNTFVDKEGHGNCQKEYTIPRDPGFESKARIGCYVQEPSSCTDTINQYNIQKVIKNNITTYYRTDHRLYSMSQACKFKDE